MVSLTEAGAELAADLLRLWPAAEHWHRPAGFAAALRAQFRARRSLACIASTGLVSRVLAPVLTDKRRDPPVLALDEAGRFVVALLSGHEGGANAWAWETAFALRAAGRDSQAVITSSRPYLRPARVAGLGCARGAGEGELAEILEAALARTGWRMESLTALASLDLKADETGLRALAARLGLPLITFPATRLADLAPRLANPSPVVAAAVGCPGVAEGAALAAAEGLAGAGEGGGRLVVEKLKTARATCALAEAHPRGDET